MSLTGREREIVDLLRQDPLLDAATLAERLGATKASVAVHLSNLTKKGVILGRGYVVRAERGSVVVVGGANMDVKARSRQDIVLRTSNPGSTATSPGGVGRNIAENLARLGTPTHLVAPIGRDAFGEALLGHTRGAGVLVQHLIHTEEATGTYLAVLDNGGELVVGVSDMAATDTLTVEHLARSRDLVAAADLLVVDGNLPGEILGWLLDVAASAQVPTVVEPVSVAKAGRLAPLLNPARPVLAITPNVDELAALVGADVSNTRLGIAAAARRLHERGVIHVWVRRGRRGSVLSSRAPSGGAQTGDGRPSVTTIAAPRTRVVDVTGAGDAMTAAFVHALLRGDTAVEAAEYGHRAAALTVASQQTVRADLTDSLIATLDWPTVPPPRSPPMTATRAPPHPMLALSEEVRDALGAGRRRSWRWRARSSATACRTRGTSRWPPRSRASSATAARPPRRSRCSTACPGSGSPATS